MREIKFRAWDKLNNMYCDIFKMDFCADPLHTVTYGSVLGEQKDEHLVIEQYTGLKDKHGKEIYEGDIVSNNSLNYSHEKLIITFVDGAFCIGLIFAAKFFERITIRDAMSMAKHHDMELVLEVLGNIHENPELFKCEDN